MNAVVPPSGWLRKFPLTAGCVLLVLMAYAVPLFVRMPVTNDAQMYDLQVRLLNQGGVLYQDILEPNLPGVVWIQSLVRHFGGMSSETLRVFDLLVFLSVACLIHRWLAFAQWSPASRLWVVIAMLFYYVSQSEWCHCQRDGWLLLPVWGALTFRLGVIHRQQSNAGTASAIFGLAFLEGLCWGVGVWLKPHVVIPAALVWITGCLIARPGKRVLPDFAGLLLGGLVVGGLGVGWMIQHQCWAAFWDTARNWNPRYFAAGREHWTLVRFLGMSIRLSPWMLLHLPALMIAARALLSVFSSQETDRGTVCKALLSACYLGWLVQALFLQHLFDYIYAPTILLALLLVAFWVQAQWNETWCRTLVIVFAGIAVWVSPFAKFQRVKLWQTCLSTKATPKLYSQLAVLPNPKWLAMQKVIAFLQEQNVQHKDVGCFQSDLVSLYNQMDLLPPTRFVYVYELLVFFPDRQKEILLTLKETPHRFIVTDTLSGQLPREQIEKLLSEEFQNSLKKPLGKKRAYPWGHPIVFRAGNYLVHQVVEPSETSIP